MAWLILALLIYAGVSVDRLRAQHFGSLAAFAVVATIVGAGMRARARYALGEDGSAVWQVQYLAVGVAVTFALYCGAFCLGRTIGYRGRRKP